VCLKYAVILEDSEKVIVVLSAAYVLLAKGCMIGFVSVPPFQE